MSQAALPSHFETNPEHKARLLAILKEKSYVEGEVVLASGKKKRFLRRLSPNFAGRGRGLPDRPDLPPLVGAASRAPGSRWGNDHGGPTRWLRRRR